MRLNSAFAAIAIALGGSAAILGGASLAQAVPAAAMQLELWPTAKSPASLSDAATETRIDALIAGMTLEQKVGQIIQADIGSITPADLATYPLGSILAGGNSGPYGDERADAAKWARLVGEFRAASQNHGAGIPILFGIDAVHGHNNLPGATLFPHNVGLGAAHDPELVQRIGAVTAAEIAGSGIEWTFAPTLAVPQDLRWGRAYEGYSSDPALVASYGRAMTLGLQGELVSGKPLPANRVAATAKHFLADGGTVEGRDQGDARLSEQDLVRIHAAGYPAAIDAGALTVMASFSSWNGVKHHGSHYLLTDVLKGRMGFAGLVVGDWNGHGQVPGCTATDCPAAINAGLDLYMAPDSWKGLYASTLRAARDGRIPLARLNDAVRRILRVKFKLGLMGEQTVARGNPALVGAPDHLAVAREAVAKSLVLLKNEGGLLPVKPGSKVLVAGPGADDMAMQAGGWTITWQGTDTKAADYPRGNTIGKAIVSAVGAAGGQAAISADGSFSAKPDVAIVVMGETPYAEFQGDIPHLAFAEQHGEGALVARLKAQGIPVVVVFLSGRPLFTGSLINRADAFVAAWLPGSQGEGVADVLVARADGQPLRGFTGRLSFPWPADARSPIAQPLFPLGYGLRYGDASGPGRVNEDPRIDLSAYNTATSFFVRGKALAPWHLSNDGSIAVRAVDLSAQEDARQFTWSGRGALSLEGNPVDLSARAQQGETLLLDWRIDRLGRSPVHLTLGGAKLDLTPMLRRSKPGTVLQTRIPLRCFAQAGAKLASVGQPLRIEAAMGFGMTIRTARIDHAGPAIPCPRKAG
ncbi:MULTISPECIES: glycoside hydrolase family 3 protein [unclassified Novosphingobium]|uniref:glycoside hydrolase family 3 protein n=1 Tax=unclassified Novosphingobium TaxID=2644732 RepID=UPI000ED03E6D|nr:MULTISPECIES: glycoside hydrolase family 3 protein [unclassified Novosphingobium]HCF25110.1 1,4-beta-D-glucan glucohydrolase [Novosphingobium sp.]HQV02270.1 glycoside hydrolase family 3 N-terminal domain-containing protein [Novosphingobium sp.]